MDFYCVKTKIWLMDGFDSLWNKCYILHDRWMLGHVESLHPMEQPWNWNTVAVVRHKVNTQVFVASLPLTPAPDIGINNLKF